MRAGWSLMLTSTNKKSPTRMSQAKVASHCEITVEKPLITLIIEGAVMSNIAQTAILIRSRLVETPKTQKGGFPMTPQPRTPQPRDWRYVAEQIRDEKDSKKMMDLEVELDRLLESDDKSRRRPH